MKKQFFIVLLLFAGSFVQAQIMGCTDPLGKNYNPMATVNDGSCEYKSVSVAPEATVNLAAQVEETSGLVLSGDELFTHNDNTDTNIYKLDTATGAVLQSYPIIGAANQDWEEIAQDSSHFYIGDFGNNLSGNRANLHVLKVSKESVLAGNPQVSRIDFTYSDQTDFSPQGNNDTDFDCEAMIVSQDSIYLFTKQWVSKKTSVYALPKTAGSYTAQIKATYNVNGLITGATYLEDKRLIVLCGYSGMVSPFFYLLYDFNGHDFFSGNKRKVTMGSMSFHQAEGIATANGLEYFVSNEHLAQQPFVNVEQKLHRFDLSDYLSGYFENLSLAASQNEIRAMLRVYPNPTKGLLYIDADTTISGAHYTFYDANGKDVVSGNIKGGSNRIDVGHLASGIYTIKLDIYPNYSYRLVKK